MFGRKKIAMVAAEFLGTGLLTMAVLAVGKSSIGIPYFVATAAALVVAMAVLVLGNVSGAHLNPIVTIGLWTVRRVKTVPAIVYVVAQLLGGIAAYTLFSYLIKTTWSNVEQTFDSRMMIAEAVGGLIFALGWAATVYQRLSLGRAAATIGISLMLAMLIAGVAGSGGFVNPAVALGARSWVWWTTFLGPVLGAIIGFNLYSLLFAPANEVVADEVAAAPKKKAVVADEVAEDKPAKAETKADAKKDEKSGKKNKK